MVEIEVEGHSQDCMKWEFSVDAGVPRHLSSVYKKQCCWDKGVWHHTWLFLIFRTDLFLFHVYEWFAHVYVYASQASLVDEEGIGSPGAGINRLSCFVFLGN